MLVVTKKKLKLIKAFFFGAYTFRKLYFNFYILLINKSTYCTFVQIKFVLNYVFYEKFSILSFNDTYE